jgi:hypothetical protein
VRGSLARSVLIRFSSPTHRRARPATPSRSNPARAPRGTRTRSATAGAGLVQRDGGPIEEVHPGDVVWFEPHEKHWHGAALNTSMTHTAIQESLDGKAVEWMEQVSDEQYQRAPGAR